MTRTLFKNIIRFVSLVLIQGLILYNVNLFNGLSVPFFYIYFILMLPLRSSPVLVLVLSFAMGLAIDSFYNTPGIHASASIVIGFMRYFLIRTLAPRDSYDLLDRPTIYSMGLSWYLRYAIILAVIHHAWFFILDGIGAFDLWMIIKRTFLSSIFTFTLLIIAQYLFSKPVRS
ncbi:MAG: hypothetical protein ACI8XB_000335 [Patiriisocius sp.]|jgi:hypothetical protein